VPTPSRVFAQLNAPDRPAAPKRLMGRAVVLGGSMAGLLAARVLSDHADEVLLVERDADSGFEPRPGVPQGTQVHALLPAGGKQLERWFPGFGEEAVTEGAVVPPAEDVRQYVNGNLHPNVPVLPGAGVTLVTTRPFLEGIVRARVAMISNIRTVRGRADGLVIGGGRVTAVHYHPEDGEPLTEPADMVVDAMGRSSRLGDWLADAGWPRPPMRRMPIRLNYATAMFKRDPQVSPVAVVVSQDRPAPGRVARIGGVNAVEGDRWITLIAGYADDRPSRDPADFAARCWRDFPSEFGDIAENAEMTGDVVTYHQADSRRRDYHELDRLPAGLVAAGDAVASFNPVDGPRA
jgi:2-polyprenyl-6-methoxyphenol hydroxylase-like FAD-dependent oxidoreductase